MSGREVRTLVITVGAIKGGIRFNIIPDSVEMIGTIRTFDQDMRTDIINRMRTTASSELTRQ